MKKGFTLIELLAVIILLAVISTIVVPIVSNIVQDSKKSTYQSSIELYGKAVKQAILNYELDKKVTPTTFKQIKPYLEFEGNNVECDTKIIYEDGEIYLKDCSVDGNFVEDYTYGKRTLSDTILKHAIENNYYYEIKPDFSKMTTSGDYGLYTAEDDLGDSYYFRGDVENNYVKFGTCSEDIHVYKVGSNSIEFDSLEDCENGRGTLYDPNEEGSCAEYVKYSKGMDIYWKVIRTNGDGTVRIIYTGVKDNTNDLLIKAGIALSAYDEAGNHGYTYTDASGNQIDSTIKSVIDSWYNKSLEKNYSKYIADGIFCNDKSQSKISETAFYPKDRLFDGKNPILTCPENNDKYSLSEKIGNGLLSKPVGLITADELLMAGIIDSNIYSYLNDYGWTITPRSEGMHFASITNNASFPQIPNEVYPVINIKADVRFDGTGTMDDPYIIMTD